MGFDKTYDDETLAVGLGASIEVNLLLLLRKMASYSYINGESQIDERGNGVALEVEGDLFAGVNIGGAGDVIGGIVKTGIGGSLAGAFSITLYCDNDDRLRGEIAYSGNKDWGVSFLGASVDAVDSTDTVTLTLDHEQLLSLAEQLTNVAILSAYFSTSPMDATIIMGPARLKEDFVTLFSTLNTMTVGYRRERETGRAFTFSPELKLALGIDVALGISLEMEKSVSFLVNQGIVIGTFGDYYPEVAYTADQYIPDVADLEFNTVIDDCAGGVFTAMETAGKIVLEAAKTVGSVIITPVRYLGKLLRWEPGMNRSLSVGDAEGEFTRSRPVSLLSRSAGSFGINGAFGFSPEGMTVSEITAGLTSPITVDNANAVLGFSPGAATAELTVSYSDADITALNEGDLKLFVWHAGNQVWVPLASSVVDLANNRIRAQITALGTFAAGVLLPQGEIVVKVTPEDVEVGQTAVMSVAGTSICYGSGQIVDDGTLVTVAVQNRYATDNSSFGTIITADADPTQEGVQVATIGGRVDFTFTPSPETGLGTAVIASVAGNASGYCDFSVVDILDSDSNNLPDFWEIAFFGSVGQDPGADPDNDGLTNREEYEQQTDPGNSDTDGDGMSDLWEVENGLNPRLDDAKRDSDLDGVTNKKEFDYDENIIYVSANGACDGKQFCFSKIGTAYDSADSSCPEIRIKSGSFTENIEINKDLHLLMSGGWDDGFNMAGSGGSIVHGNLIISAGCLQVENLSLGK